MEKRALAYVALFTLFVCLVFVAYNPNIAVNDTGNFTDGELITSQNNTFDFKKFTLNCPMANNFTTKTIITGHTQFVDDDGDVVINYLELDRMIPSNRDKANSFLTNELKKPSWTVDGISVHEINFVFYDNFYSAYYKNSTTNTILYISSENEQVTADMMNSLNFMEV